MTADQIVTIGLLVGGGYLVGSIPVAWLITRLDLGADLRRLGSGNVGVMNTALSVHRWAGALVLVAEVAKGVLAVLVARQVVGTDVAVGLTALAAFVGTRWPVWLGFQGGRGNTLAASAFVLIAPLAVLILLALQVGSALVSRSNFIGTRVMLAALPPVLGIVTGSWWWAFIGLAFAGLFLTTHRPGTDDHLLLKQQYPGVAAFLMAPRRHRHPAAPGPAAPPPKPRP